MPNPDPHDPNRRPPKLYPVRGGPYDGRTLEDSAGGEPPREVPITSPK